MAALCVSNASRDENNSWTISCIMFSFTFHPSACLMQKDE